MTDVNEKISKRALFIQEFRNVVETKNIWSKVATKVIAKAKNIYSPFTSVSDAKSYKSNCVVPVAQQTVGHDELILDRHIGNAITDCEEELSYANFNLTDMWRGDLYASVQKKSNTQATADFIADATDQTGTTRDLSTADKVRKFLIETKATADRTVSVKQKVDGATIKRCEKHGQPFIACGSEAFVQITSMVASIVAQSSLKGMDGNYVETPYGVTIVDLGEAADDPKDMIFGTAGVPTLGYREDKIDVGMGEMTDLTTYDDGADGAGPDDLDITHGDKLLSKTWYLYANTKGKNGIFSNVQSLVAHQKMA